MAIDFIDVVCGCLDGYWERGINFWDMAVGIVIVWEVGGIVFVYDCFFLDLSIGCILVINGKIY